MENYAKFMIQHRGVEQRTAFGNALYIERFMLWCQKYELEFKALTSEDIFRYIVNSYYDKTRAVKKNISGSLRSFLRFLYLTNRIKKSLDEAVPQIYFYKNASLPSYLSKDEIKALLKAPDLSMESGRRDHAMLLLMARYGVRLISVKSVKLQHIDWKKGVITFPAVKGGSPLAVPLLPDVARALLRYIKKDRGESFFEQVFLTVVKRGTGGNQHAKRSLSYCNHMSQFKNYYNKAGIQSSQKASHILRHSFATHLIQGDVPIKNISDLLGHRNIESTYLYAKVDVEKLRSIANVWPVEAA